MKISRDQLLTALRHVCPIIEERTTVPILSGVLLDATSGILRLTATDMGLEIVETVQVPHEGEWHIIVPGRPLLRLIEKMTADSLEIAPLSGRLIIQAEDVSISMGGINQPEDFPRIELKKKIGEFEIPRLAAHLARVAFAISSEETRYYLNGVYLHQEADTAVMVATDGHKLAKLNLDISTGLQEGIIIPRKAVEWLRDNSVADARVMLYDPPRLVVDLGMITLTTKLIDGKFPDYQRVIPKQPADPLLARHPLIVSRHEFMDAIFVTRECGRQENVTLEMDHNSLTIAAQTHGDMDITVRIEMIAEEYQGDPMKIAFNKQYLLDILSAMKGRLVQFIISTAADPVIISDPDDPAYLTVLMPMRL